MYLYRIYTMAEFWIVLMKEQEYVYHVMEKGDKMLKNA